MTRKNPVRDLFDRVRPRMRPRFVIIGAQKAGTSALYEMFRHHPKALPPDTKELDYFNDDVAYAKGYHAYATRFPAIPIKSRGHFTFEASPSYMYHAAKCAPRIAKHLPDALCVAILRDPVKRAYSAWNMRRDFKNSSKWHHLYDDRSFETAVEDELAGRTPDPNMRYLARSQYAAQLKAFMDAVGNQRLFIRSYKDFKSHPGAVVNDILKAVCMNPLAEDHASFKLKDNVRPYYKPLDSGLARELYKYFAPYGLELNELLGYTIDLSE